MMTSENDAFAELERSVRAALETYSNVHRGSGHNSLVTTHLYEQARQIVLLYLGLDKAKYVVIFCTPRRAETLESHLIPGSYRCLSSQDCGLPLGIRAMAVEKKALPNGAPFQTGGGTARLVFPDRVIWANAPDRYEAGTPAIVNVIAFARALQLMQQYGKCAFKHAASEKLSGTEILHHDELMEYSGQKLLDELRKTLIGGGLRVPTLEGERPFINLDNGASTPTFTPVWNAVCQTWQQPQDVQQEVVRQVRSICAGFLGAPQASYDVVFTSNTTEAINLAAESLAADQGSETVVVNTLLEHNSNELPWRMIPGVSLVRLPVDDEGFIDLNELETVLRAYNDLGLYGKKRIKLMAVSGASNVLGLFNDLPAISRIVHRYGVQLLVDAAQLVAHRKVELENWGIDYLAFSAHKAYAPFGSGVLVAKKGLLNFDPVQLELIQASGEENAGGIAAMGKALLLLQRIGLDLVQQEEQALTRRTLNGLAQIPGLQVFGVKDAQSPRFAQKGGVILFRMKNLMPDRIAKALAEQGGIGVRYGCHCAHLMIKRLLHVGPGLARLQGVILKLFPRVSLPGLVRVSLGIENRPEDIEELIKTLGIIARQPDNGREGQSAAQKKVIKQQMDAFVNAAAQNVYTH